MQDFQQEHKRQAAWRYLLAIFGVFAFTISSNSNEVLVRWLNGLMQLVNTLCPHKARGTKPLRQGLLATKIFRGNGMQPHSDFRYSSERVTRQVSFEVQKREPCEKDIRASKSSRELVDMKARHLSSSKRAISLFCNIVFGDPALETAGRKLSFIAKENSSSFTAYLLMFCLVDLLVDFGAVSSFEYHLSTKCI